MSPPAAVTDSPPSPCPDQIALPDFSAGAMENWGLITYRETALLYNPLASSNGDQEWVATVIAHELAHMVLLFILLVFCPITHCPVFCHIVVFS